MPFSYPAAVCHRNDLLIYIRLCFFWYFMASTCLTVSLLEESA